jgi:hypothetical protein
LVASVSSHQSLSIASTGELAIDQTFVFGQIPPEIGNLGNLTILNLQTNSLTGPIPSTLGQISTLETVTFLGNPALTGVMPPEICAIANDPALMLTTLEVECTVICDCCTNYNCRRRLKGLQSLGV